MKDDYTKFARVFSSIAAMTIPFIITIIFVNSMDLQMIDSGFWYANFACKNTLIVTFYGALIYFARELFRVTAKQLFKGSEVDMPTTRALLWSTSLMSKSQKKEISKKVNRMFHIKLLSEEEELKNPTEAKLAIVDAVRAIRNITRNDKILLQKNKEFGFFRNYLGASVYAIILIIVAFIINHMMHLVPLSILLGLLGLKIILCCICFLFIKDLGLAYSNQLYSSFITMEYRESNDI